MSKCRYYAVEKRQSICKHPTFGELTTNVYNKRSGGFGTGYWNPCERCKRRYGGRYPSELPNGERDWENEDN